MHSPPRTKIWNPCIHRIFRKFTENASKENASKHGFQIVLHQNTLIFQVYFSMNILKCPKMFLKSPSQHLGKSPAARICVGSKLAPLWFTGIGEFHIWGAWHCSSPVTQGPASNQENFPQYPNLAARTTISLAGVFFSCKKKNRKCQIPGEGIRSTSCDPRGPALFCVQTPDLDNTENPNRALETGPKNLPIMTHIRTGEHLSPRGEKKDANYKDLQGHLLKVNRKSRRQPKWARTSSFKARKSNRSIPNL